VFPIEVEITVELSRLWHDAIQNAN